MHTSGKKLYEQKIVVIVMVTITEAIKQYKKCGNHATQSISSEEV